MTGGKAGMRVGVLALLLALALPSIALPPIVWAAAGLFEDSDGLPPVIEDKARAPDCTVTWLVTDITTNDTIGVRMRIASGADDLPVNGLMPCPPEVPPRVAARALDACIVRVLDPKICVYADMSREFQQKPGVTNTSENASRCASDKSSDIGIACWRSGELQVCGVGCGADPERAIAAAAARCEAKHQRTCPITGSLPVLAPK